ncbi:MAG: hypothetical protein AAFV80_17755 [Bacteroidota bacterium]
MRKSNVFFGLMILLFAIGCSESEDVTPPSGNSDRNISFNGAAPIVIDTLQGQFVSEYQVSNTATGSFSATNFDSGQTILVFMIDEDENSFPFTSNGVFPVNNDAIRSTIRYTEFGGVDIQATSGSITVTAYERIEADNRVSVKISGTFNASDGTDSVEGTFNNITLQCLQCE